jgi:chlorophyllase
MQPRYRLVVMILVLNWSSVLFLGCSSGPCTLTDSSPNSVIDTSQPLFVDTGDPYEPGPMAVQTLKIKQCEDTAPFPLQIYAPETPGAYPVVVFQHGFLARNSSYSEILRHLASHGFIVVAPQMYEPSLWALLGHPTAAQESDWVLLVLDWLPGHLDNVTGLNARTDRLGLAGHSRGGKVIWQVMVGDPTRGKAIAGVDPVDGTGGPLGNQPRVIQGSFAFSVPALVIGTGLRGSCAPEGDNHVQFYAASNSPAWHVVAVDQGHTDMLDEGSFGTSFCPGGPNRAGMRRLTAGLLVAFFRGSLQGDPAAYGYLTDTTAAPIPITAEAK